MKEIHELPRGTVRMRYAWLRAAQHSETGSFGNKFWGKYKRSAGRRPCLIGYTEAHARADRFSESGHRSFMPVFRQSKGCPGVINNARPFWRARKLAK